MLKYRSIMQMLMMAWVKSWEVNVAVKVRRLFKDVCSGWRMMPRTMASRM